jgi:hypothetical protein
MNETAAYVFWSILQGLFACMLQPTRAGAELLRVLLGEAFDPVALIGIVQVGLLVDS